MGPSLDPEREKMIALRMGESVVLPWPKDRTRQTYFRSISVVACRMRRTGFIVVTSRNDEGMRVERVSVAPENWRKHGELWDRLSAMDRQEVWSMPCEDGKKAYWRVTAVRDRLQKASGRVYRVKQAPGAVIVERRA